MHMRAGLIGILSLGSGSVSMAAPDVLDAQEVPAPSPWSMSLQAATASLPLAEAYRTGSDMQRHLFFGLGLARRVANQAQLEADAFVAFPAFRTRADENPPPEPYWFGLTGYWQPVPAQKLGLLLGPTMAWVRADTGRVGVGGTVSAGKMRGSGMRVSARYLTLQGPSRASMLMLAASLRIGQ